MKWEVAFPECDPEKMSVTDWRILRVLRKDPRRKLVDIANDATISARTLKRRLDHMEDEFAFFLHAQVNLSKLGGVAYRLLTYCDDIAKKGAIDDYVLSSIKNVEWSYTLSDEYSMFIIHCENTIEAEHIMNLVKKQDGVSKLRMDIIEDQITVEDWIDEEIEQRITAAR